MTNNITATQNSSPILGSQGISNQRTNINSQNLLGQANLGFQNQQVVTNPPHASLNFQNLKNQPALLNTTNMSNLLSNPNSQSVQSQPMILNTQNVQSVPAVIYPQNILNAANQQGVQIQPNYPNVQNIQI